MDNTYWTNILEIRTAPDQPRIPTETFDLIYRQNVDPVYVVVAAIFSMLFVNVLALVFILLRRIAVWIVGAERT